MGTLAFERGALTLGQQMAFERELDGIVDAARRNGSVDDPVIRQRLADLSIRLRIMRLNALRILWVDENVALVPDAMIDKLFWANLHQDMGEVAMDVLGAEAMLTRYSEADEGDAGDVEMSPEHQLFFFSRSDTIYGGSDQIQRNIIGERALGLPREPAEPVPRIGRPDRRSDRRTVDPTIDPAPHHRTTPGRRAPDQPTTGDDHDHFAERTGRTAGTRTARRQARRDHRGSRHRHRLRVGPAMHARGRAPW